MKEQLKQITDVDCMGIGLNVLRPEQAIVDPSRLVVKDIYPIMFSIDNFLECAKFNLI